MVNSTNILLCFDTGIKVFENLWKQLYRLVTFIFFSSKNQLEFYIDDFQIYKKWPKHHNAESMWIVDFVIFYIYHRGGKNKQWGTEIIENTHV